MGADVCIFDLGYQSTNRWSVFVSVCVYVNQRLDRWVDHLLYLFVIVWFFFFVSVCSVSVSGVYSLYWLEFAGLFFLSNAQTGNNVTFSVMAHLLGNWFLYMCFVAYWMVEAKFVDSFHHLVLLLLWFYCFCYKLLLLLLYSLSVQEQCALHYNWFAMKIVLEPFKI